MIHYSKVEEWFELKVPSNRAKHRREGRVAVVHAQNPDCSWDVFFSHYAPSTGQEVCLEEKVYKVLGVETFKPGFARKNEKIGIWVGLAPGVQCPYHAHQQD